MTPVALSIFVFALLTHDTGKCLHRGIILSGVASSFSLFSAVLPVSSFSGATRPLIHNKDLRCRGLLFDFLSLHFSGSEADGVGSGLRGFA